MDQHVWKCIENLSIGRAQLVRVRMYRHSKFVSRRQLKKLYGWQYIRSLINRFSYLTDERLCTMIHLLDCEIEYLLDKQMTSY